jgi:hypothetical protein
MDESTGVDSPAEQAERPLLMHCVRADARHQPTRERADGQLPPTNLCAVWVRRKGAKPQRRAKEKIAPVFLSACEGVREEHLIVEVFAGELDEVVVVGEEQNLRLR